MDEQGRTKLEGLDRSDQVMIGMNGNDYGGNVIFDATSTAGSLRLRWPAQLDRAFIVSHCAERPLILRGSGWAYTHGPEAWRRQASARATATRAR